MSGMHDYRTHVSWRSEVGSEEFLNGQYSRGHFLQFECGPAVRSTASHSVVGKRWAEAGAVDPEQMLVAAISSCHLLSFLHVSRDAGFIVLSYEDNAEGTMEKNALGRLFIARVVLRPKVVYSGTPPTVEQRDALHHRAHEECFIANSVRTEISVQDHSSEIQ
jgi:organic hydroperoxide reductase OsmC/OhrA